MKYSEKEKDLQGVERLIEALLQAGYMTQEEYENLFKRSDSCR